MRLQIALTDACRRGGQQSKAATNSQDLVYIFASSDLVQGGGVQLAARPNAAWDAERCTLLFVPRIGLSV